MDVSGVGPTKEGIDTKENSPNFFDNSLYTQSTSNPKVTEKFSELLSILDRIKGAKDSDLEKLKAELNQCLKELEGIAKNGLKVGDVTYFFSVDQLKILKPLMATLLAQVGSGGSATDLSVDALKKWKDFANEQKLDFSYRDATGEDIPCNLVTYLLQVGKVLAKEGVTPEISVELSFLNYANTWIDSVLGNLEKAYTFSKDILTKLRNLQNALNNVKMDDELVKEAMTGFPWKNWTMVSPPAEYVGCPNTPEFLQKALENFFERKDPKFIPIAPQVIKENLQALLILKEAVNNIKNDLCNLNSPFWVMMNAPGDPNASPPTVALFSEKDKQPGSGSLYDVLKNLGNAMKEPFGSLNSTTTTSDFANMLQSVYYQGGNYKPDTTLQRVLNEAFQSAAQLNEQKKQEVQRGMGDYENMYRILVQIFSTLDSAIKNSASKMHG